MPTNSVVEFIIYVLPGFLALEIYRSKYPTRDRSDLIKVSWSIAVGLLITTGIATVDRHFLGGWLGSTTKTFPGAKFMVALAAGGFLVGGLFVAYGRLRPWLISRGFWFKGQLIDPLSIWGQLNKTKDTDWAVVYLSDGTIYMGFIRYYRNTPHQENQDFLLSEAKRVDDKLKVKYSVSGKGVYLNTRDVIRIEYVAGHY